MELFPDLIWKFRREHEELEVRRNAEPTTSRLSIATSTGVRTMDFTTHAALVESQVQFESQLIADGWRFVGFEPERRQKTHLAVTPTYDIERRRSAAVNSSFKATGG